MVGALQYLTFTPHFSFVRGKLLADSASCLREDVEITNAKATKAKTKPNQRLVFKSQEQSSIGNG